MKLFKCLAVASAAAILLSSCSILKGNSSDASSSGITTGSALAALYKIFKSTGTIDLSNLTNIINLGKILTGAGTLADATNSFTDQFVTGLINGSSNLVNNANAGSVVNALKALSNIDTSAITAAATAAANGTATQLSNSTAGVASTLSSLTNIFNLLN